MTFSFGSTKKKGKYHIYINIHIYVITWTRFFFLIANMSRSNTAKREGGKLKETAI